MLRAVNMVSFGGTSSGGPTVGHGGSGSQALLVVRARSIVGPAHRAPRVAQSDRWNDRRHGNQCNCGSDEIDVVVVVEHRISQLLTQKHDHVEAIEHVSPAPKGVATVAWYRALRYEWLRHEYRN